MRNELINQSNISQEEGGLIEIVMDCSKEEALQRYERPFYDIERGSGPTGWYNMLCRTPALFTREQFAVFRAIHQWRDQIAREEDESVHVIMPKHVLYNLAREMPVDMPSLLGSSHPISKSFKNRKSEILTIIQRARMLSHNGPDMKEIMHTIQTVTADRSSKFHGAEQVVSALAIAKMAVPPQPQRNSSRVLAQSRDSRFWGSTISSILDRGAIAQVPRANICLALPMPRLTAEIFEDTKAADTNPDERPQNSPGARAEHQYMKDRKIKADGVLTVKKAGGPRKRKATDPYDPSNAVYSRLKINTADHAQEHADRFDQSPTIHNEEQQSQNIGVLSDTKEEKRAQRLESMRLKKEGLRGNEDAKSQKPGVEPFDYAYAPSMLHAQRDSNRRRIGKETNPYTKLSDAPKGMRKAKKEQEGRSLTFKG